MKPSARAGGDSGGIDRFETRSPRRTVALGMQLAERLSAGDCVALVGPLGAGKTVLVRGLALGLGLDQPKDVSSPTYVLVHEYPCRVPLFHLDLYRMIDPVAELGDLGLDEMLGSGVVVIEWADRAREALPADRIEIHIEIASARTRRFSVRRT